MGELVDMKEEAILPMSELTEPYMDQLEIDSENPYLYHSEPVEMEENKRLIVVLDAPSGAGKDTIMEALVEMGICVQAVTGTSRGRRWDPVNETEQEELDAILDDTKVPVDEYNKEFNRLLKEGRIVPKEPAESYIWRRRMKPGETPQEYAEAEKLLEWDPHYGYMYGLAEEDFLEAFNQEDKVTIVRTDVSGKETLRKVLPKYGNVLSITLVGDDWESAEQSIRNRSNVTEEKIQKRLNKDKADMPRYIKSNFVVHNSRRNGGLEHTIKTVKELIERYS